MIHRRVLLRGLALATISLTGCQEQRLEDQPPPPAGTQADTTATVENDTMMMPDTSGVSDTAGVDRSPTPGATPPEAAAGGSTINFETGTATTSDGREIPVGGVTSGGVTTREGAAAEPDSAGDAPR